MNHYWSLAIKALNWMFARPIPFVIILAVMSNCYLIADYAVVNRSSFQMLWSLSHQQGGDGSTLSHIIAAIADVTSLNYIDAGHVLMVVVYAGIALLMVLIARLFGFALVTQWALIFLLLSHPTFNDFRSYIIVEPLFWLLWLLAIYWLLKLYKTHTILGIFLWLGILLLATRLSVAAWFWLLLFPFGALFWRPWRRKSVAYALLGYALVVGVLLFLPLYQGHSAFSWLQESIIANPEPLFNALRLSNNNWVKEGDTLMSGVFVFSGATSLIVMRAGISLSIACVILAVYAVVKKQQQVFKYDYLRIIIYAIIFDFFITVILLLLSADNTSVLSFSVCFLLLLFSALGLSYVFKKIYLGQYSRPHVVVIIWCLVAYFASGFIIFGPKQDYLKEAGKDFLQHHPQDTVYSNDSYFLFYANKNPATTMQLETAIGLSHTSSFYYAHRQSRKRELPISLQPIKPIKTFANERGDRLILYWFETNSSFPKQNNQGY